MNGAWGFINKKSCETYENTFKSQKSIHSFILSKDVQCASLESLLA